MQQYFKTGKTIIIDDQYVEARPLMDALLRSQIPFFYTEGKPNSSFPLPNVESKDAQYYNLVFLDLNLDFKFAGGQIAGEGDERTFKSTHAKIFNTIIKNENRSFILVIWSNEEENYREEFLKIFQENEIYKTNKKPYRIISLTKTDFFTKNADGNYDFISGKEQELNDRINAQLADLEAFKLFYEWDRVVSISVSDAIDDLMGLVNHISDEKAREEFLSQIITAISIAYSGDDGYLNYTKNEEKTDSVFLALTQILNDDIDRNVLLDRQEEFENWKASDQSEINQIRKT